MVDETRVARLLRSITDDVAFLEEQRAGEPAPGDTVVMRAIKYAFVTAIEAAIDVAQHLCASEGWGPPDTNADAFGLLATHGVLPPELAGRMSTASGFRNVLVHHYVRVDDLRVLEHLDRLDDLRAFCAAVAKLLS